MEKKFFNREQKSDKDNDKEYLKERLKMFKNLKFEVERMIGENIEKASKEKINQLQKIEEEIERIERLLGK